MNINSIGSSLRYNPCNAPVRYGSGSFADMLAAEQKISEGVDEPGYVQVDASFPCGEKQILRVDSIDDMGRKQSIRVEYTADSTPEDPIVRIYGTSYYGEYSYVRRLRDIDLTDASYTEMYALLAHEKTLERGSGQNATPGELTLERIVADTKAGDFMEKRNYLDEYARNNGQLRLTFDIQITPDEAMEIDYRVDTSAEDAAEQAEFERLMRTVDKFIEDIREDAEVRKEKAEKEIVDELIRTEADEAEAAIERIDQKKIMEELL